MPYIEVSDSVLAIDKPVRSLDHKQTRDNIKFHHHGQSGVDGVFAGVITPTQLTANQNDWNPTGLSTASTVRASSDRVVAITGLQQGLEGQCKIIMNVGSFTINFPFENTGSSAANRFANGFSLRPGKIVAFIYDSVASRWRTESAGAKTGDIPIGLLKWSALNMPQAATQYMKQLSPVGTAGVEADTEQRVTKPFTMKELRASSAAAVPASNSEIFTVRKNGADTALTCTIGAGQQSAVDSTNSVNFGYGDRFAIKIVSSATAGTNDLTATARMFEPGTEIGHPELFLRSTLATAPGRFFAELGGVSDPGGVDIGRSFPLSECLVGYMRASGTLSFDIRKNNVALAVDAAVETDPYQDTTARIYMNAGDTIAIDNQAVGNASWSFNFKAVGEDAYDPCPVGYSDTGNTQGTTRYMAAYGWAGGTVESELQIPMPACRVRNMRGVCNVTPPLGQTQTITVRKNGVATALTMQFTNAGGILASNTTNEVTFAAGDLLSVEVVSSASLGNISPSISFEAFA